MSKSLDDIFQKIQRELKEKRELENKEINDINQIRENQRKEWLKRIQIYERSIFENQNLLASSQSGRLKRSEGISGFAFEGQSTFKIYYFGENGLGNIASDTLLGYSSVITNNPDDQDHIYFYEGQTSTFGKFNKKTLVREDINNIPISLVPTSIFYDGNQFILTDTFGYSPYDVDLISISSNGLTYSTLGKILQSELYFPTNFISFNESIFSILFYEGNWYFTTIVNDIDYTSRIYLLDINTCLFTYLGPLQMDTVDLPPELSSYVVNVIFGFSVKGNKIWASIYLYNTIDLNIHPCMGEVDLQTLKIKYLFPLPFSPDFTLFTSISFI